MLLPTRVIHHNLQHHPPVALEPLADRSRVTILESFDNHERHERNSTAASPRFAPTLLRSKIDMRLNREKLRCFEIRKSVCQIKIHFEFIEEAVLPE
jgi:hypothetical protein